VRSGSDKLRCDSPWWSRTDSIKAEIKLQTARFHVHGTYTQRRGECDGFGWRDKGQQVFCTVDSRYLIVSICATMSVADQEHVWRQKFALHSGACKRQHCLLDVLQVWHGERDNRKHARMHPLTFKYCDLNMSSKSGASISSAGRTGRRIIILIDKRVKKPW